MERRVAQGGAVPPPPLESSHSPSMYGGGGGLPGVRRLLLMGLPSRTSLGAGNEDGPQQGWPSSWWRRRDAGRPFRVRDAWTTIAVIAGTQDAEVVLRPEQSGDHLVRARLNDFGVDMSLYRNSMRFALIHIPRRCHAGWFSCNRVRRCEPRSLALSGKGDQ